MGKNTGIEWAHHTACFWWGCTEVGCHVFKCYAKQIAESQGLDIWGNDKPRKHMPKAMFNIFEWNAIAHSRGEVQYVFVNSMSDFFEKSMPLIPTRETLRLRLRTTGDIRDYLFEHKVFEKLTNLKFLFLTKRPSNINKFIPEEWKVSPPPNVAFGTTVIDQKAFDQVVPQLLKVNGHRYLSIEPQMGPIDITTVPGVAENIHGIIQGGESGKDPHPFDLDWAQTMQDQCRTMGIPYFFKQIDKVKPIPKHLLVRQDPFSRDPELKGIPSIAMV